MNSESLFPYQFHGYEPGIFAEIYLPKKSEYQGKLYETLTNGFDFKKVRDNFKEKKAYISILLENFTEMGEYTDERVDSIESLYWGYSMYEVDGVFFNPKKGIIEERTQIIRIMFLPDLEKFESLASETDYKDIRRLVRNFLRADSNEREAMCHSHKDIATYLNEWKANVGVFLFGYLIFELCERIKELNDAEKAPLEEEIWVSSFWNLEVNKVKISLQGTNQLLSAPDTPQSA
ncbi:MAG TPA: hypothetical protein VGO96_18580 [Pyrinomonadaceae bacterium]|jgi:hypothetical protein|nr:hypothetical protein [Pyrinomonadaceae bacterium]